uniref:Ig-like domain-containing protein n=1 Tax=Terrapene triunguis TaxID=2587831 RepID=A0A674J3W1_9SAUR
ISSPCSGLPSSSCWGRGAQPVVTQPPSESVSPGNTVKLSCTINSGTSISGYYVSWCQQKPGNSPRHLLYYYSESNKGQGSGVPARFSGSKDMSSNAGYLTISGVLAEDEADYYCVSASPLLSEWGARDNTPITGFRVAAVLVCIRKKNRRTCGTLETNKFIRA